MRTRRRPRVTTRLYKAGPSRPPPIATALSPLVSQRRHTLAPVKATVSADMNGALSIWPSPLNLLRNYSRGNLLGLLPFVLYYALLTLLILPSRFGWSPGVGLAIVASVVLVVSFNGLTVTLRAEGEKLLIRKGGITTKTLPITSIGRVQCTAIQLFQGKLGVPIYRIFVSSTRGPWDLLYSFSGWGYWPATLASRLRSFGIACDDLWLSTSIGDLFDDDQGSAFPWIELMAYVVLPVVLYFAILGPFVR